MTCARRLAHFSGGTERRAVAAARLLAVFVVLALSVAAGALFGAGDQYLGSLVHLGAWSASASLLSAPWLVLPFAVGCTQLRARTAMLGGLAATASGLAAYWAMLDSPLEGAEWSVHELRGWLASNVVVVVGGLITGPLYGYLGQRWRVRRAWLSAVLVAGALCLEPFAQRVAGRVQSPVVSMVEVAAGAALAAYFGLRGTRFRRDAHALC